MQCKIACHIVVSTVLSEAENPEGDSKKTLRR